MAIVAVVCCCLLLLLDYFFLLFIEEKFDRSQFLSVPTAQIEVFSLNFSSSFNSKNRYQLGKTKQPQNKLNEKQRMIVARKQRACKNIIAYNKQICWVSSYRSSSMLYIIACCIVHIVHCTWYILHLSMCMWFVVCLTLTRFQSNMLKRFLY